MSNRPARLQVTSGLQATGAGVTGIITGSRVSGSLHRQWVCFGHRRGGAGTTARTCLTKGTGDRESVFMEALTTAMATPEMATGAADGIETHSTTTPL
jgi:hypothetical protein